MEQHPIPQQISSYEFKLVGDMTLKQFLKAAAGVVLAIIINSTKLMVLVKWPLMLFFGGLGLALAFVPFEDRPLEVWIVSFLKSIYLPTIYTYKKRNNNNWLDIDLTKKNSETDEEVAMMDNVNLFVSAKKDTGNGMVHLKKGLGFKLGYFSQAKDETSDKKIESVNDESIIVVNQPKVVLEEKKQVFVPIKKETEEVIDWRDEKVDLNLRKEKLEATGTAVFGSIPMPVRPEIANVIVGMATDGKGKIVDGVIVEIQDERGNPARVIKTNSLGQFKISTPLANGRYLIIAEKDNYIFDRVYVDLNNQIVEPIKIIAHN